MQRVLLRAFACGNSQGLAGGGAGGRGALLETGVVVLGGAL
jgi:hypothetical protein